MKLETLTPLEIPTPPTEGISNEILEQLLPELILLDSLEFCNLFDISLRTAYEWRRDGLIAYLRIQGRLYYRLSDVMDFMTQFTYKNDSLIAKKNEIK